MLEKERGALEQCEEEITARRARVTWLEQIKADEWNDRNLWRSGLVPIPVWRRKNKKHAAKRKKNELTTASGKKRKVDEESLEKSSSGRRVRLLSDSNESESECSRVSDKERSGSLDMGSCLTLSVPELDSIVAVWSQINL